MVALGRCRACLRALLSGVDSVDLDFSRSHVAGYNVTPYGGDMTTNTSRKNTMSAARDLIPGDYLTANYSRRPIKVAEVSVEGDVTRIRFAHSPLWTGHKSATRFHVSRKVA